MSYRWREYAKHVTTPHQRHQLIMLRERLVGNYTYITADARALPNFLLIGAKRSGTTQLFNTLRYHPQVVPARLKEVHFFDRPDRVAVSMPDRLTQTPPVAMQTAVDTSLVRADSGEPVATLASLPAGADAPSASPATQVTPTSAASANAAAQPSDSTDRDSFYPTDGRDPNFRFASEVSAATLERSTTTTATTSSRAVTSTNTNEEISVASATPPGSESNLPWPYIAMVSVLVVGVATIIGTRDTHRS